MHYTLQAGIFVYKLNNLTTEETPFQHKYPSTTILKRNYFWEIKNMFFGALTCSFLQNYEGTGTSVIDFKYMIQLTQVLKITNVKVGYGPGTGTGIPESLVQHTFLRHIFDSVSYLNYIWQGYTNPGLQFVVTTVLCTVAPNICRSSVWNLPHVTLPALRIFRWLLHFRKFAHP